MKLITIYPDNSVNIDGEDVVWDERYFKYYDIPMKDRPKDYRKLHGDNIQFFIMANLKKPRKVKRKPIFNMRLGRWTK